MSPVVCHASGKSLLEFAARARKPRHDGAGRKLREIPRINARIAAMAQKGVER